MKALIAFAAAAVLLSACRSASPAPDAGVRGWGTLREALRDGEVQGRVDLDEAAGDGVWGVGALEGLAGEVTIVDGDVWVTVVDGGSPSTTIGSGAGARATVLAAARVAEWIDVPVPDAVDAADLDAFVESAARAHGLDTGTPFVFRVEGALTDLRLHVIAGECPMRARALGETLTTPPYELAVAKASGGLVGVYAEESAGELCHRGSRTHVHAVLTDGVLLTGHVEAVGIAPGAVLRLPRR